LTRSSRWFAAAIALFSVLFMQLAVAAYACPQLGTVSGSTQGQTTAAAAVHTMSCCEMPDPVQPALCHAHMQADKQLLDKPEPPPAQVFVPVGLALPVHFAAAFGATAFPPLRSPSLARTTAPPLSIRHCCFRI
jgi:hypothetical protein